MNATTIQSNQMTASTSTTRQRADLPRQRPLLSTSFIAFLSSLRALPMLLRQPGGFEGLWPGEETATGADSAFLEVGIDRPDWLSDRNLAVLNPPDRLREYEHHVIDLLELGNGQFEAVEVLRPLRQQRSQPVVAAIGGPFGPLRHRIHDQVRSEHRHRSFDAAFRESFVGAAHNLDVLLRPTTPRAPSWQAPPRNPRSTRLSRLCRCAWWRWW